MGKKLAPLVISAGRNYALYTAENLVHEFGHILDFRTGGVRYPDEWQLMRNEFGRLVTCGQDQNGNPIQAGSLTTGFDAGAGWDISLRQNKMGLDDFDCANPTDPQICQGLPIKDELCLEMEIERIVDMFLFWVYSDSVAYTVHTDDPNPSIVIRAEAMQSFAHGIPWSRNTTSLIPKGFLWIDQIENAAFVGTRYIVSA